ncbi:jouberin-like [Zophobas morio]|uniref:jouberin-like n=1 Tax=Zophobas morio TaxID=2755281 RepID=UPI003083D46D
MPSYTESCSSVHSFSVKNQTKEKFDALLKTVIQKKKNRKHSAINVSKEKLLNDLDSATTSTENLLERGPLDNTQFNEMNENVGENYILNKFLGQQSDKHGTSKIKSVETQNDNDLPGVKPPVPKPRKKKIISPSMSQGTFEVTSPKIVKAATKCSKNDENSSSNKTYNVEEIGDVVVHQSPLKPKIIKRKISSKNLSKDDSTKTSDNESKTSQSEVKEETTGKNKVKEKDETLKESRATSVNYEIENIEQMKIDQNDSNEDMKSQTKYNYERIFEIIVHKTDRLQLNSLVIHPLVKIHIVDTTTGKYFPKSDKSRSVVFFYENNDNDYISPVMTHSCNLQEKRILYPSWEESILLNDDYGYFKDESHRIIVFFEILDFVSFAMLPQLNDKVCTSGWHSIAFAFLKAAGKDGSLNIGKKLRLQLYHSCQSKKYNPQICNPWIWWKKKKLKKYSSSLYVTIKSVVSPTVVVESFRSKTPVQKETSSKTKLYDDVHIPVPEGASTVLNDKINDTESKSDAVCWTKRPNESCKLPNKCFVEFNSYDQGCFVAKFSHNGIYLACAVQLENLFYIVIYSVLTLQEVNKICAHQALIYDIKWSRDDSLLLSASADNTVSVFSTVTSCSFIQILPHPCFVYTCDINDTKIIASGCYDGLLRIWRLAQNDTKFEFQMFQELDAHTGYVTSVCFSTKCSMFSADSTGVIIEWYQENLDWILKRQINLLDLKETIINQILLFPKGRKLLVHSRDNVVRIIDIKSGCVLQWLRGSLNKRFRIIPSISSCGNFVYAGSENGFIHVWNSKSGHEVASYVPYPSSQQFLTIHCVDFHPHDNILVITHYGRNFPILMYKFDQHMEKPTVELTVKEKPDVDSQSKDFKLDSTPLSLKKKYITNEKNIDFKGVLAKMDSLIMSQKN